MPAEVLTAGLSHWTANESDYLASFDALRSKILDAAKAPTNPAQTEPSHWLSTLQVTCERKTLRQEAQPENEREQEEFAWPWKKEKPRCSSV